MWNTVRSVPLGVMHQNIRVSVVQRDQIADVLGGRNHAGEFMFGVLPSNFAEITGDVGQKLFGAAWLIGGVRFP